MIKNYFFDSYLTKPMLLQNSEKNVISGVYCLAINPGLENKQKSYSWQSLAIVRQAYWRWYVGDDC